MRHLVLFITILFCACTSDDSAQIYPEILVPEDYLTIQEAIDHSNNVPYISLADGTYAGNVDFRGKYIILMSRDGILQAIVDDVDGQNIVMFNSNKNNVHSVYIERLIEKPSLDIIESPEGESDDQE